MADSVFEYDALAGSGPGSALRVLVVDDNDDAAVSIATLLKECGHEASTARTGDLALQKGPQFNPDVMFIDVVSPALGGVMVARRLRETPPFASTPLVAVTDDEHLFQAAAEGFDDFLCRPYSIAHIRAIMARIGARVASSHDRLSRSREMAARSRAMNEESHRGLEAYRRQRQFDRGGKQICVVFLACDPTLAECIVDQIPPGRLATASFASLEALLVGHKSKLVAGDHCLVIDGTTDQIDGLSVFSEIARRQWTLPVVALVRHGDVRSAVHFMRAGACDVIEKPSAARDLPTSIWRALSGASTRVPPSRPGFPVLSGEERRLLQLTVGGALTKQIAREMGISLRTVQLRRSALRKKLGARTAAELIRLALRAGWCQ